MLRFVHFVDASNVKRQERKTVQLVTSFATQASELVYGKRLKKLHYRMLVVGLHIRVFPESIDMLSI